MRLYDAELHNRIANHSAVYPHIAPAGFTGTIDFAPCAEDRSRFVLLSDGEEAATIFERSGARQWEMHVFMLPSHRGRAAILSGMRMLRFMYRDHGAEYIWGKSNTANRAALWYHRQLGGRSLGTRDDPNFGSVEVFAATRDDWEERAAKYPDF